ncbi:hypothetical protein BD413DRAFT_488700 [Trametes elegans]|nr:hypothetical protein BD413DRAFT_488700 [Trametes elegans]
MSTDSESTHSFPAPVGGAPLEVDFAPSILFAVLYAFLVPVAIYRAVNRRSRTAVYIGSTVFTIERVVAFGLRAYTARHAGARLNNQLEMYFQMTFSGGFISMANDLNTLLRAFLVDLTFGTARGTPQDPAHDTSSNFSQIALTPVRGGGAAHDGSSARQASSPDQSSVERGWRGNQPRMRARLRALFGCTALGLLVPLTLNLVSGILYKRAISPGTNTQLVQVMRITGSALATLFLVFFAGCAWYAMVAIPRVPRKPTMYLILIPLLLHIIGIYRLDVMFHWTTSLLSIAPGSQNRGVDKAFFYTFHIAPEWLAVALLLSVNIRRTFRTGMWGDFSSSKPVEDVE